MLLLNRRAYGQGERERGMGEGGEIQQEKEARGGWVRRQTQFGVVVSVIIC